MDPMVQALVEEGGAGRVVVISGAGLSAASGIPTFRGPEGYWTVGSTVYRPMELATNQAFAAMPRDVWRWYLYRRTVCRAASPNPAHHALVRLEAALGDRFHLISQNVDGLHRRAGQSADRMYEVHGNIDLMRDATGRDPTLVPIPEDLPPKGRDDPLTDAEWARLVMPDGRRARPHVLWFDEYYDETLFRFHSAIEAAARCDLLIVVGSSGTTNLPMQAAHIAYQRGAAIVDIDPEDNPFAQLARRSPRGAWVRAPAVEALPELVTYLQ